MFRRRTDQVYSTLQQVQRRITEQTGAADEAAAALAAQPLVNLQPLANALPAARAGADDVGALPQQPLHPPLPRLPTGERRYVLQLSGEIALTLAVVWILSIVVAFVLGQRLRSGPGAGLAAGDAGSRTPAESALPVSAASDHGDYVLELESIPKDDVATRNYLEAKASELNDSIRNSGNPTYKPYFGVRRANSGSQQLVFGLVDGVFGVNRERFAGFADIISKPRTANGAGYTNARWVQVGGAR